jgi:nucleolar pre-ribosomal-associated protein 2
LEKASAPFDDQLVEAGKFIGVELETVGRKYFEPRKADIYHGREEWLLRWVLKKLSDKKDAIPRQNAVAWWLLGYLIKSVPRNTAARLLVEKKLTEILKVTLEGVRKAADEREKVIEEKPEKVAKNSKKRKRTPVTESNDASLGAVVQQMEAIHSVVCFITSAAQKVYNQEDGRDLAFTAEYMKTAIRTLAEESATILGLWLSLSTDILHAQKSSDSWLSPFIELWQDRTVGENDLMFFSSHCTRWVLQLLQAGRWKSQLEMLLAKTALLPARSDWLVNAESPLLSTLTKLFVIQNPANAALFFDISIRSVQTHGNGRRKQHDDSWLQLVFNTLQEGFLAKRHQQNCTALHAMLASAIRFKKRLDLPSLRKVASQYALAEEDPNWELVAALLKLDGNVFLIPDPSEDLLNMLLVKITKLPFKDNYEWSEMISSDIVIPLMKEFTKARDLTGFLHHWHTQLVSFESLRNKAHISLFSAWEGESLQNELQKIFESSLTVQQITQILDWLEIEVKTSSDAVSVILQAIAGAIANEDVVDTVNIRLHSIVRKTHLDRRYRWRSSSIFSKIMDWLHPRTLLELESASSEEPILFDYLRGPSDMDLGDERQNLETLEIFRSVCALWNASVTGSVSRIKADTFLLEYVQALSKTLSANNQRLLDSTSDALFRFGTVQNSPYRGFIWSVWCCVRVLFLEYPKALT